MSERIALMLLFASLPLLPGSRCGVTASPYCVELLTESGHPTTTDACPDP